MTVETFITNFGHLADAPTGVGKLRERVPMIVWSYKSAVTKDINELRNTPGMPVWQGNYYERVIRNIGRWIPTTQTTHRRGGPMCPPWSVDIKQSANT